MTQWLADDPMARRYEQRFSQLLEDSMIQWLADDPMARRCEQRFSQRLEDLIIQWLADDQLDALRSEVSAAARGLDDAMVDVTMTRWKRKLRCRLEDK